MNDTNRGLNRIVLLVAGLLLLAVGAMLATAALWPAAGEGWTTGVGSAATWMQQTAERSRISDGTTLSWLAVGVLTAVVVVVVVAIGMLRLLGRRGASAIVLAGERENPLGPITIRGSFAADAITHSLAHREEILASRVAIRRVRHRDVLHVSVTPRQNTPPGDVATAVGRLVDNLAVLTGRRTPAYISIHAGLRARLAGDRSRVD